MRAIAICSLLLAVTCVSAASVEKQPNSTKYEPTWESLDARPLPEWFDDAKIGIFPYWGVSAVPAFGNEWFWQNWLGTKQKATVEFMKKNYPPNFSYQDFASQFKAEFFDPNFWAQLFKASGAKYVIMNTKHHDGYTLWPSNHSWNWNAGDVGPRRDLVGDLGEAVRKQGLRYGLYHSLFEWFHPLYLKDQKNGWHTQDFVDGKMLPEIHDIVNTYQPDVVWSDGDWQAPETYWKSKEFLTWLYNESPIKDKVVVNDRWGIGTSCKHGGFLNCPDRYKPKTVPPRKWENSMTLDRTSWSYVRRNQLSAYYSIHELILETVQTVAYGGNILIAVGPTADGRIIPVFEERLLQLGDWLSFNGEAIYKTKPWKVQKDTVTQDVYFTKAKQGDNVYAIFFNWPADEKLVLGSVKKGTREVTVSFLDKGKAHVLPFSSSPAGELVVDVSGVRSPVQPAWVLRITGLD